jgi:hypothetical protein
MTVRTPPLLGLLGLKRREDDKRGSALSDRESVAEVLSLFLRHCRFLIADCQLKNERWKLPRVINAFTNQKLRIGNVYWH